MSILQWLLLGSVIILLFFTTGPAIKKIVRKIRKKDIHTNRMLVVIRRRQVGIGRLMELTPDKQKEALQQLDKKWRSLHEHWQAHAKYIGGFMRSEKGLAMQQDEEWGLLDFYDLVNYDAFLRCQDVLEDGAYLTLRNHYDIRLFFGKRFAEIPGALSGLT